MNHPYPEGARVKKTRSQPDDAHADGARATIVKYLGCASPVGGVPEHCYFVVWDDMPGLPVAIIGSRIRLMPTASNP